MTASVLVVINITIKNKLKRVEKAGCKRRVANSLRGIRIDGFIVGETTCDAGESKSEGNLKAVSDYSTIVNALDRIPFSLIE